MAHTSMPHPEKSAGADLERVDEQLLNIHVQLTKLDVLVELATRNADAACHPNLIETIRHHRDEIVESSRAIARRIDAIGRHEASQRDSLQRDIHKNCG